MDYQPVQPEPFDYEQQQGDQQVLHLTREEMPVHPDEGAKQNSRIADLLDAVVDYGDIPLGERRGGEIDPKEKKLQAEEEDVHEDEGGKVVVSIL
jgi:hypothetical protein